MKNLKNALVVAMSFLASYSFSQNINPADVKNPTIKSFLMAIDGTEPTAEKLIARLGSQEVIDNGMIPMGRLKSVNSQDGNCVQFTTLWVIDADDKVDGYEEMTYDICEEGGKLISFDLVFDDEEEEEE